MNQLSIDRNKHNLLLSNYAIVFVFCFVHVLYLLLIGMRKRWVLDMDEFR